MNDTVDLSGLTKEDFVKAKRQIGNINDHGKFNFYISTNTVEIYLTTCSSPTGSKDHSAIFTTYVFDYVGNFEIKVGGMLRANVIWSIHRKGSLNAFPVTISQIGVRKRKSEKIIWSYNQAKNEFPSIDGFHKELIAALKTQSKEDFYDDASDYQDDEPTDFGDASNYDEALVQRIKEILK